MKHDWTKLPESLWPLYANGFTPTHTSGHEHVGTAPWNDTPGKVYANATTGQWKNHLTDESGNALTWMKAAAQFYHEQMTPERRRELAALRKLPSIHLDHPDVGWDPDAQCFTIAHRTEKGHCRTVRRYLPVKDGKRRLLTSKGTHPYLFNAAALATLPKGSEVWVCESEWDALAVMGLARFNKVRLVATSPGGASIFAPEWVELLRPFRPVLAYDHDEAGVKGESKAFGTLTAAGIKCQAFRPDANWQSGWDLCKFEAWGHANQVRPVVRWTAVLARLQPTPRVSPTASLGTAPTVPGPVELDVADCPTFAATNAVFGQHFQWTPDLQLALKVVLAVAFAARLPGTKLFLFLIGEPGSGKTEICDKLDAGGFGIVSSTITPRSLVSGQAGTSDPSLLVKLAGKCWVVKDYTEILSKHSLDQEEINSTLRGAFDGYVRKDFGNGVVREYRDLHFSHVAAVTPIINGRNMAALGERYLKLHLDPLPECDATDFLLEVARTSKDEPARQNALRDAVGKYLARRVPSGEQLPPWSDALKRRLAALVQVTALVRTQVDRELYGERELRSRPTPERPTRLFKQLLLLGSLVAFVEDRQEVDEDAYAVCERVGFDTAVGFGLDVVQGIVFHEGGAADWQLVQALRLPFSTVKRTLEDLRLVGLVTRLERKGPRPPGSVRAAAPSLWKLSAHLADLWTKARVRGDHAGRLARYRGGAYSSSKKTPSIGSQVRTPSQAGTH